MKKALNIVFVAIVTLIAAYFGRELSKLFFSSETNIAETMKTAAEELNKQTPMMVDNDTRLDAAEDGPGLRFTYLYTLVNYSVSEIDVEEFRNNLAPNIRKAVCENPELAVFYRNDVTVVYVYRDKNGMDVTEIEVPPTDCKQ